MKTSKHYHFSGLALIIFLFMALISCDKKDKKPYSSDSIENRLSQKLLSCILERNPKHKKQDLQKWGVHIDGLIRLDNRSPQEIEKVIEWCQAHYFWKNNILSTGQLRKQFDRLFLEMSAVNNKQSKPYKPTGVVL